MTDIVPIAVERWDTPIPPAVQHLATTALEAGHVIHMPGLPFTRRRRSRACCGLTWAAAARTSATTRAANGCAAAKPTPRPWR